jgi:glutaredoxin
MKIALAALLILLSCTATAEIYKWTDKQGVVHYEDQQPTTSGKSSATKVEKMELSPIQILDDGKVNNISKENEGWVAEWLGRIEDLKQTAINQIGSWTGKAPVASNKPNTVEIYTTTWCGACKKAKQWLQANGVAYKEYDVQKDANAALRMRKLGGGGGVPFTVINGETFQGFSPSGYQAALN